MRKIISILAAVLCCLTASAEVIRETHTYAVQGNDTLRLDRYIDNSVTPDSAGYPAMIYIHGGGFVGGSRINAAQEVYADWLAKKGWQVFCIDYRLAGFSEDKNGKLNNPYNVRNALGFVRMASEDVVAATNFILSREWKINPAKVCLSGGSAGAITALQTEYDLCNGEDYTSSLPEGFNYAGVISHAGAIASLTDTLEWRSVPCPIMMMHGTADMNVPIDIETIGDTYFLGPYRIVPSLQKLDASYWKFIVAGADHVMAMLGLTAWHGQQEEFIRQFVLNSTPQNIETTVNPKTPPGMADVQDMIIYVPLYILGYGKYLNQMNIENTEKPKSIVY